MRDSSLYSLLLSFCMLLSFVVAQSSSSPSLAAPTASTASPPPATTATGGGNTQTTPTSARTSTGTTSAKPGTTGGTGGGSGGGSNANSGPPDVLLRVPELHIGKIELDVDNLQAEVNLAAEVANLVSINAGVQIGIKKVNISISEVNAELELVIRLGHLVDIVNRTLATLDLNPLLINVLNEVEDLVDVVIGAVDGLLGSILSGGTRLNFLIDNLGNIVQEVVGTAGNLLSTIVGNYQQNMTFTGAQKVLDNGLIQKTYNYTPLGSLVNIIFNSVGQVVQAVVVKGGSTNPGGGGGGGGGGGTTTTRPTATVPTITAPPPTSTGNTARI